MKQPHPAAAPVTIPLVVLTVHPNGTLTVTVDGTVVYHHVKLCGKITRFEQW
jgi:hypothetical protein